MSRYLTMKNIVIVISFGLLISSYAILKFFDNESGIENHNWFINENDIGNLEEEVVIEEESAQIMVDIKGEIAKPGVYVATNGERVIDLVERAGGMTEDALVEAVNLALHVEDEMVIYIPKVGEEVDGFAPIMAATGNTSSSSNSKVNLNKASADELQTLTGIGPAKASAIIEYRETNGPFQQLDDLLNVSGIGSKTFEKISEQISVK